MARPIPFLLIAAMAVTILSGCGRVNVDQRLGAAVALAREGREADWKAALTEVEPCVNARPDDPTVTALHILCLERSGSPEKARAIARDAARVHPHHFLINYQAGRLLMAEDNHIDALGYLRTAHELRPDHLDCLVLLAACAGHQNVPEARDYYQQLIATDTFRNDYVPYNELGIWYVNQGRFPEAISSFSQASAKSDNHPLIYLNMAVTFDRYMKKPKLARRFYNKYLIATETRKGSDDPARAAQVSQRLRSLFAPEQ